MKKYQAYCKNYLSYTKPKWQVSKDYKLYHDTFEDAKKEILSNSAYPREQYITKKGKIRWKEINKLPKTDVEYKIEEVEVSFECLENEE